MIRLSALLLAFAALPAQAGDCLLRFDGSYFLNGPCDVGMQADGSFAVRDHRGMGTAQVVVTGPHVGEATFFQNGETIPLGRVIQGGPTYPYPGSQVLDRNPSCWFGGNNLALCHDW